MRAHQHLERNNFLRSTTEKMGSTMDYDFSHGYLPVFDDEKSALIKPFRK